MLWRSIQAHLQVFNIQAVCRPAGLGEAHLANCWTCLSSRWDECSFTLLLWCSAGEHSQAKTLCIDWTIFVRTLDETDITSCAVARSERDWLPLYSSIRKGITDDGGTQGVACLLIIQVIEFVSVFIALLKVPHFIFQDISVRMLTRW